MSNTIQIKHGSSPLEDGVLQPYELGYCTNKEAEGLYIGLDTGFKKIGGDQKEVEKAKYADNAKNAESAKQAENDIQNQRIDSTYIKEISADGTKLTLKKGDNSTTEIQTQDTTYSPASISSNGLMSNTDKTKLDSIEEGANKTVIDSVLSNSSTNPVQNKVIYEALKNTGGMSLLYNAGGWQGSPGVGESIVQLPGTGYQVLAIVAGSPYGVYFTMLDSEFGATLYSYDTLSSVWCQREFYFYEDYDDISGQLATFMYMGNCTDLQKTKNYNIHLQLIKVYKVL